MSRQKLVPYSDETGMRWQHFFTDLVTKIFYYYQSVDGRKIKFSCETTDPKKAKAFANKELARRLGKKTSHVRTLVKDELKLYMKLKESEGWGQDTMNNIRRAVRQIGWFWGNKLPSEINVDNVREWTEWWRQDHPEIPEHKPTLEMENAIKYMRNFCQYLVQKTHNGLPLLPAVPKIQDPNRKKIKIKRAEKKERILSAEDFKKIYFTAESEVEQLIVLIMYTMATRIDETLKLDFTRTILLDLEVPVYKWRVGQNKADLVGQHALHPALIDPLRALRERRRQESTVLLFPQKRDSTKALREQLIDWDAWRKRADIGWHWTPHTFRHTCLSNLFNNPALPQASICKQYRVSLAVAMETYIKTTQEAMMLLRDAIKVGL